ncbi:HAD family phosphatase [Nocardiopsis sp. FIRDI 009]|uniref:HAD family hydrolase n=1 Tax=Nocardiopsis sp. FIRDI 009 TaxID=714197 RepID=UPI000E24D373|nr:HAD-IB family hydrolase [Nocardiopsis sp. FIRDI 009]
MTAERHDGAPVGGGRVIAFFDVDETLVAMKNPFELVRYRLRRRGDDGAAYEDFVRPLRELALSGVEPVEVSREFYRALAGVSWFELCDLGRQWYADLSERGVPFVASAVAALREHQVRGHVTVAVSGAWSASLRPITDDLGIDLVLCTEPELDQAGRLTGGVDRAMFGPAKARAVRSALERYGADPRDCHAYADDSTDEDMLRLVGYPTVVGDNRALTRIAADEGWRVLPGGTVPGTERLRV